MFLKEVRVIASYDIDIKLGDLYTKQFLYSCVELIEKVSTTLAYSIIEHDADVEVVDVYGKTRCLILQK
nr:ankyrin repeat family protein [Oriental turtle dovepox virus]